MALPLRLFGYSPDNGLRIVPITKRDQFDAQGLEGAFEVDVPWCRAFVLIQKCDDSRAIVRVGTKGVA